jgi:hypothetical protein
MATPNDILTAANEVDAWPHLFPMGDKGLRRARSWAKALEDVDGELILPALRHHQRESRFDPTPADVLRWIGEQIAGQWPEAGVVYEMLRKHAKDTQFHLIAPSINPAPEPLPADLARVYEMCGGKRALLDPNQAAGRANVRETLKWFEAVARREFLAPGGAAAVANVGGLPVADPDRQLPPALLPSSTA